MSMWTAIVCIVAIVFIAEVINKGIKHDKEKRGLGKAKPTDLKKIEELERRIQSLESIVIELEKNERYRNL